MSRPHILRDATPDDAAAVAAIWNQIIRDTVITFWPTERTTREIAAIIAERQDAGHAFLVAEVAGAVQAFASTTQFRAGGGYARSLEHTIHAAPDARGHGLGAALLAAVETHARTQGARLMVGAITGSNAGSLAFHARNGYTETGRIPAAGWKFGQFHDLVLMVKDLSAA